MATRWRCRHNCDHLTSALGFIKGKRHGDEFDLRKFNPSMYGYRPNAIPDEILTSNPDCCPVVHFRNSDNMRGFALYADSACTGNGTPQARASVGVYGTPDAWYNKGYRLPLYVPQTNQSAEIHSAIAALQVARAILKVRWKNEPLPLGQHCYTEVLLVMDSSYVVQAMTEWMRKRRTNGYRTYRSEIIANMKALQTLDNEVRRLFEAHLVIVRFWHVSRVHNSGANKMAAEALRGNSVGFRLDTNLDDLTQRFARRL